jgi:hypothetical protein
MASSGINGKENVFDNSYHREWIVCVLNDETAANRYLEKLNRAVKQFPAGNYLGFKVSLLTKATEELDPNSKHSSLGTQYFIHGPLKIKWGSEIQE